MNLNNPVDAQSFFRDQIQTSHQGVWCVTLRPNGRILAVAELEAGSKSDRRGSLKTILKLLEESEVRQFVVAHINPPSIFFDEDDWGFLEDLKKISEFCEIPLCDYLKINDSENCSLITLHHDV